MPSTSLYVYKQFVYLFACVQTVAGIYFIVCVKTMADVYFFICERTVIPLHVYKLHVNKKSFGSLKWPQ